MITPIISLTDAALKHIQQLVDSNPDNKGFRLSVKKGGCTGFSYVPDIITQTIDTDIHWKTASGLCIFIDKDYVDILKGLELDFEKKDMGQSQLVFNNPNVKQACGCGESFSIEEQDNDAQ